MGFGMNPGKAHILFSVLFKNKSKPIDRYCLAIQGYPWAPRWFIKLKFFRTLFRLVILFDY